MILFRVGNLALDVRLPLRLRVVNGSRLVGIPKGAKLSDFASSHDIKIDDWVFDVEYGLIYLEESEYWEQDYLPPWSLKNKTVLDVGAGCGESAKFFLDHGASIVIAVEPNRKCWPYLEKNAANHRLHIVEDSFNPQMIYDFKPDYVKVDIEGYETLLIPYLSDVMVPMVVECHNKYVIDEFLLAGFTTGRSFAEDYQLRAQTMILHRWNKT